MKKISSKNLYWVLQKYDLLEEFTQYKLKCANCGKILEEHNIGSFVNTENGLKIYCNSLKCRNETKEKHEKAHKK